jgi:hypothetical protein
MDNKERLGAGCALFTFLILVGGVIGWVMNIITLAQSNFDKIDGEIIVRAVGIIVAPVGAIVGWL